MSNVQSRYNRFGLCLLVSEMGANAPIFFACVKFANFIIIDSESDGNLVRGPEKPAILGA